MRIRVGETELVGQAVDLRSYDVRPGRLVAAVRDSAADLVVAPSPDPIHRHVGLIRPGMQFDCGGALADAGRSIGLESPQAAEIARLDREIAAIEPASPDLRAARQRAAEAGADLAALKEAVARISGRLNARRDAGLPTAEVEQELDARTRELTEAETAAIAAEEALSRAEARAETARDERERRLSLVDSRENRRREARQWFRNALGASFERSLRSLPVSTEPARPSGFAGPAREAALAIARIAGLSAPVVLADGPFETAVQARGALDCPVVLARV
ncbi:MAG: hypothetical protein U5K70_04015 [Halodesulfurarchaeum sp.]|nr:hypothetical protein [Halodesulfurarchaeum sp.]